MNAQPHYQFINQPAQLPPLLAAIDRSVEIAIDTEADNLFRYKTRVCLLQILAGGEIFLVDLLADLPLDDLWARLATKPLIMHGSDYDLRLLHGLCAFRPLSLFDTMFAAQLLSIPRFGLAALLEQNFGVKLDKDHQKANWSQRPLDRDMLDYAALDVHYLLPLRDRLRDELVRLGRLEWFEQKCRWQIEVARDGFAPPDENDWRIGGAEKLRGRGLAILHALWHWRESWAEKLNTPPFKVTGNELLMRLSRAAEEGASPGELLQVHLGRRHDRLAPSLETAIRRGFETDPRTLPRRERRRDFVPMTPEELSRQDRIKAIRDRLAAGLTLDPTLIATRTQLALLARDPAGAGNVLLPWQAQLLTADPAWNS
ncbi:Ribonuclease D [Lacunisphaera limnophila]|uniref:Ribonuclease D n=1 Tax=Lacunisphaera limnophila TaxID=1838286 RepID=A0A1D8ASY1_9BACT|nr:ribonuclease D [Lacunisphaera limnophila]AOS44007.1 Ribonuclease D [Lacunisphaera limnophila]